MLKNLFKCCDNNIYYEYSLEFTNGVDESVVTPLRVVLDGWGGGRDRPLPDTRTLLTKNIESMY